MKVNRFNQINESNNDMFWMVEMGGSSSYGGEPPDHICFKNKESADNFVLNAINDEYIEEQKNGDMAEEEIMDQIDEGLDIVKVGNFYMFADVDEAINWNNENTSKGYYNIDSTFLHDDVELDKELKMVLDAKKYNI